MPIYLDVPKVKDLYLGTSKIKEIYLGTQKIYSGKAVIIKDGVIQSGYTALHNDRFWNSNYNRFYSGPFAYDADYAAQRVKAQGTSAYRSSISMVFRLSKSDVQGRTLHITYTKSNTNQTFKCGAAYCESDTGNNNYDADEITEWYSSAATKTTVEEVTLDMPASLTYDTVEVGVCITCGQNTNTAYVNVYDMWLE